jgi:hypothetical protein
LDHWLRPDDIACTILHLVPGCEFVNRTPDFELPDRPVAGGEFVLSKLMDPPAAAKLLDVD